MFRYIYLQFLICDLRRLKWLHLASKVVKETMIFSPIKTSIVFQVFHVTVWNNATNITSNCFVHTHIAVNATKKYYWKYIYSIYVGRILKIMKKETTWPYKYVTTFKGNIPHCICWLGFSIESSRVYKFSSAISRQWLCALWQFVTTCHVKEQ